MRAKTFANDWRILAFVGAAAIAGAVILAGVSGLAGMTLGLVSGGFGAFVLWQLIQLVGKAMTVGGNTRTGTVVTVLAFFAKLPLYIFAGMLATRLGHGAFSCFLTGVVLVYFGLIAWALARP
jgi:hypothetical protein